MLLAQQKPSCSMDPSDNTLGSLPAENILYVESVLLMAETQEECLACINIGKTICNSINLLTFYKRINLLILTLTIQLLTFI